MNKFALTGFTWRHGVLTSLVLGALALVLSLDPIPQDPAYHRFADQREFLGIPNFFDVVSNLPFLIIGWLGVNHCRRAESGPARPAWIAFFVGVFLVGFGSAYYHWSPSSPTLVWDRLPMTIGFMGLFVAVLTEYVHPRIVRTLLVPAILLGAASVFYWQATDDLRPYAWIQFMPLLVIPTLPFLFQSRYSHQGLFAAALGWYVVAKLTEYFDPRIFALSQDLLSGHSIKHLSAAAACLMVLLTLQRRKTLVSASSRPGFR
jgi:hypothetical protein